MEAVVRRGTVRACFVVRDHRGHALAYVYLEDEAERKSADKLLTRDEARRIAVVIAKVWRSGGQHGSNGIAGPAK